MKTLNYQMKVGSLAGDILVEQGAMHHEVVSSAIEIQQNINDKNQYSLNSVQVDSKKFEKLIGLVGDLVMNMAKVSQLSSLQGSEELDESTEDMALTMQVMCETATCLSRAPIANIFHRLTKDISIEFNKKIKFEIIGEQTQLDRTDIEQIFNSLKYIIHNVIEHDLDSSVECVKSDEIAETIITLKAYHEMDVVVIEISDKGKGLDPEELLHIAKQRGVVDPEQSLYEDEIYQLIFEDGFSSAESTKDSSFRWTGMDTVRRNIESLRGSVAINSAKKKGLTVTIRLPLSLTVIDGLYLRVADQPFILPMTMLVESINLDSKQISEINSLGFIKIKDRLLPVIKMGEYIGVASGDKISLNSSLIIVESDQKKIGLIVDEVKGEAQVVVKRLGATNHDANGFSCYTLLESGQLALILDIPSLMKSVILPQNESKIHKLYV